MAKFERASGASEGCEIKVTRYYDAPRELVYRAWSDPGQLAKWWGPRGFTIITKSMEVRPGGAWVFDMRGPDNTLYPNRIVYSEIIPGRKVAYFHTGEDECADAEFHAEITFEDDGQGTRVTLHSTFPSAAACSAVVEKYGAIEGGIETLERLADIVMQQLPATVTITREFDAPRAKLFEVWIRANHLHKWYGPKGCEIDVLKADMRSGGTLYIRITMPDKTVLWCRWDIREILPPERLIIVDCFADAEGNLGRHPFAPTWPQQMLTTVSFEDLGARTRITIQMTPIHETAEEAATFAAHRDAIRVGWGGMLDVLDAYLADMLAAK